MIVLELFSDKHQVLHLCHITHIVELRHLIRFNAAYFRMSAKGCDIWQRRRTFSGNFAVNCRNRIQFPLESTLLPAVDVLFLKVFLTERRIC